MTPQAVLDALTKLSADQTDFVAKKQDASDKKAAAAEAQHAAEIADNAVSSAMDQFTADKKALHDLIDSTFTIQS